jgi:hypothetical protein
LLPVATTSSLMIVAIISDFVVLWGLSLRGEAAFFLLLFCLFRCARSRDPRHLLCPISKALTLLWAIEVPETRSPGDYFYAEPGDDPGYVKAERTRRTGFPSFR